ncbi:MAG: M14 family metallopeptidase [Oscillospiraceae bacterium]|nr:M14 family metallopeptidase [Oscillospiraceae bacterium]
MEKILKIGTLAAAAGEKVHGFYQVEGTDLTMPVTLINGRGEGKVLLLTAGVHPDEYPGIAAAIQLSNELQPADICGGVVIVPMTNYSGFLAKKGSHVPADGKNLNRLFPGDPNGTEGDRLADAITKDFHSVCDYNIDLHSGGIDEEMKPLIFFSLMGGKEIEETSRQMALSCSVSYIVRSTATNGEYSSAVLHGLPSLLLERGGNGFWSQEETDADKRDVRAVLKHLGILACEVEPAKIPVEIAVTKYYESDATGCWYPCFRPGERVQKGELLGEIRDHRDQVLSRYYAEYDGVVLYQTSSLSILKNKALVAFGKLG